jgi:hypothetical protein
MVLNLIIWLGFTSTNTVELNSLNEMCTRCWFLPPLRGKWDWDIYATENTFWTVSQKTKTKKAHCPLVSEHKNCSTISNCDQVSWKLCRLEGAKSRNLQTKKAKMYPAFIHLFKFMLEDGSFKQHEKCNFWCVNGMCHIIYMFAEGLWHVPRHKTKRCPFMLCAA